MWDNTDGIIQTCDGFAETPTEDTKQELQRLYRDNIKNGGVLTDKMRWSQFAISTLNALVYLPDEYKMVAEEGDNNLLDFSKNLNEAHNWLALIPDYDRKTHTLAYKRKYPLSSYFTNDRMIYDPKNAAYANRNLGGDTPGILPVIFDEIIAEDDRQVVLD